MQDLRPWAAEAVGCTVVHEHGNDYLGNYVGIRRQVGLRTASGMSFAIGGRDEWHAR